MPRTSRARLNSRYSGSARSGGAARTKLGRRPPPVSAYRVNWGTLRTSPPMSRMERLSRPAASSKTRRWASRAARPVASSAVSSVPTPSRTTIPVPIRPTDAPPTRTSARPTRWTSARIRAGLAGVPPQRGDGAFDVLERVVEIRREPHDPGSLIDDDPVLRQRRNGRRRVRNRHGDDPRVRLDPPGQPGGQPRPPEGLDQGAGHLNLARAQPRRGHLADIFQTGPTGIHRGDRGRPALEASRAVRVLEMGHVERELLAVSKPSDDL